MGGWCVWCGGNCPSGYSAPNVLSLCFQYFSHDILAFGFKCFFCTTLDLRYGLPLPNGYLEYIPIVGLVLFWLMLVKALDSGQTWHMLSLRPIYLGVLARLRLV